MAKKKKKRSYKEWYKHHTDRMNKENPDKRPLSKNPDDPKHRYDYKAAYKAGAKPALDPGSGELHWPSEFKKKGHPRLRVDGKNTKTGKPSVGAERARKFKGPRTPKTTKGKRFLKELHKK